MNCMMDCMSLCCSAPPLRYLLTGAAAATVHNFVQVVAVCSALRADPAHALILCHFEVPQDTGLRSQIDKLAYLCDPPLPGIFISVDYNIFQVCVIDRLLTRSMHFPNLGQQLSRLKYQGEPCKRCEQSCPPGGVSTTELP